MGDFYQCQWIYRICFISIFQCWNGLYTHSWQLCKIQNSFQEYTAKVFEKFLNYVNFARKKTPLLFPCLITLTYKFGPFLFLDYMSNIFCCKNYLDNGFWFSIRNAKFESDMIWNEMSSKKKLSSKICFREIMWEFQFNEKHYK